MSVDIGINQKNHEDIAFGLSKLLADTYTLYLKTHNFHWNITGAMFQTLHFMFEVQYIELALAVDLIAERIRSLGFPAPATYQQFIELSAIKEEQNVSKAQIMIRLLLEGEETVLHTARSIHHAADKVNDQATADLVTQRIKTHEKMHRCYVAC